MRKTAALCGLIFCFYLAPAVLAQDPVKVDPKHYTVVSENDQVRILRVHYGPHEKSVMHSHPATVAVFLTDANAQFTLADGKKQDASAKAGDSRYSAAQTHLPENLSDKPMEVIVVELKGKTAAAKPAAKAEKK